jgi:NADPH2:quinone reductase
MKAWTIVNKGEASKAFELREYGTPEAKEGELLIEVEGFGLNYADVMARNGLYGEAPPRPFVPGYEVVGKVAKGPAHLKGKRVLAFTRFTGYSQEVITPEDAAVVMDESVDLGKALALGTQYVTAYHAAYEKVNLFEGDGVLIHAAAGGVGVALTQFAKAKGCTVFGTSSQAKKLEFIGNNGVDHPVNYRTSDYEVEVKKILNGERLDVAFNSIAGSTFKKDGRLVGSAGVQVLYGGAERSGKSFGIFSTLNFVRKMGLMIPIGLMMKSKGVIGVNMLKVADNRPDVLKRCMAGVIKAYEDGIINPVVDNVYDSKQIVAAHQRLEGRESIGKIGVKW